MRIGTMKGGAMGRRAAEGADAVVSHFEFWPGWAFYGPIVLQWIGLGLRYGDFSLPTAANPRIEVGGLCGESKGAILDQIRAPARDAVAPYVRLRPEGPNACERAMAAAGLAYPVVAKPDIGCNGSGVRLVRGRADLARYLQAFPADAALLLQHYVPFEGEAGLFYIRHPGEARGRVTSVTLKQAPVLTGDGRSTLRALLMADRRAFAARRQYLPHLAGRLHQVPAAGERVRLVFVGNHCKGSIFYDGRDLVTPALTAQVEALARAMPDFHFGRFDVRYASGAALREGDFCVIEVNGVGSEATHVWDARTRLRDAWRDQFQHYRAAFEIGRANRARGLRPSGMRTVLRHWRLQRRLMRSYPAHD